jgi:hypothetical protein
MAKLTKAEKLVQDQMLALLEWAADRPKSWHPRSPKKESTFVRLRPDGSS